VTHLDGGDFGSTRQTSPRHTPARPGHLSQPDVPGDDAHPFDASRAQGPLSHHDLATDGPVEPGHDKACASWTRVGTLDDIPRLGSRVVKTPTEDIVVFRTADDHVFAMHDRCPHKQGKLSQGIVHGTAVTCPLHNWVIGLDDGLAKDPDAGCVRTIPVRLDGPTILLALA
jgi:nitrite reductase (NADH) small subunit